MGNYEMTKPPSRKLQQDRDGDLLRIKSLVFDASLTANSIANVDGVIIEVNDAFLRTWGYPHKDEATGKPIPYFLQDPNEAAAILTALETTGHWEGRYSGKRRDGSSFIAHGLATVVRNEEGKLIGYQSSVIDITERTRTETELRQSEARYRALFDRANDGIFLLSPEGEMLSINESFARMHGYAAHEMLPMSLKDLDTPESFQRMPERMRRALAGEAMTFEVEHYHKDGHVVPIEVSVSLHGSDGERFLQCIQRDITERRLLEQTLRDWNQTLEQRVVERTLELESAQRLALLSEVSAGIIHQICQPICSMGVNLAVILGKLKACPVKRCGTLEIVKDVECDVDCIRDVMTHMRSLINPGQPNFAPIDIPQWLEGVMRTLRQEAGTRRIRLSVSCQHNLPPVLADAVQLDQVILNLTRNAFDACAECPPERRRVVISARVLAGAVVELSVRDAGTGIPPETMKRLFTPFFTTKAQGLGIGLRLSQTIIEAHGGSIGALNHADGIGATFRVTLPGYSAAEDATIHR